MRVVDKVYLYVKDPNQEKISVSYPKREQNSLENLRNRKILIEASNSMQGACINMEECSPAENSMYW